MLSQKNVLKWKVLLIIALLNYVHFNFYFFSSVIFIFKVTGRTWGTGNEIPFFFLTLPHLELPKIDQRTDRCR